MKSKLLLAALAFGILYPLAPYAQTASHGIRNNDTSFFTGVEAVTNIESTGNNDFLVYPNPVTSHTSVVLDDVPNSAVYVDIIDMNGQVDRSFQYAPGSYDLDVDMSRLPTGLYSVRVSGRDIGYHNLKVIKD